MVEHFHTSPRAAILSTEYGSGKTRLLEILALLTPLPKLYFSPSAPTIFRLLAEQQITLLLDECDTVFTVRGKDDANEDLRALLNSGYKRGATIPRCVGPRHEVQEFKAFAAVALAGLGDLPPTVMSRSIIIRMRRRAPGERVEPFRSREHEGVGLGIGDALGKWAKAVGPWAGEAWPELPEGVVDRAAECWEPLIAIADLAGDDWPGLAREACVALCRVAQDQRTSLGVRLLADIKTIFGDADALYTSTLLERLVQGDGLDDEAPWGDLRGKPLGIRGLATMLARYDVRPTTVREPFGRPLKGYRRAELWDAWQRYLPPTPGNTLHPLHSLRASDTPATSATGNGLESPTAPRPVTGVTNVTGLRGSESGCAACPRCGGEGCRHCGDTGRDPRSL